MRKFLKFLIILSLSGIALIAASQQTGKKVASTKKTKQNQVAKEDFETLYVSSVTMNPPYEENVVNDYCFWWANPYQNGETPIPKNIECFNERPASVYVKFSAEDMIDKGIRNILEDGGTPTGTTEVYFTEKTYSGIDPCATPRWYLASSYESNAYEFPVPSDQKDDRDWYQCTYIELPYFDKNGNSEIYSAHETGGLVTKNKYCENMEVGSFLTINGNGEIKLDAYPNSDFSSCVVTGEINGYTYTSFCALNKNSFPSDYTPYTGNVTVSGSIQGCFKDQIIFYGEGDLRDPTGNGSGIKCSCSIPINSR